MAHGHTCEDLLTRVQQLAQAVALVRSARAWFHEVHYHGVGADQAW